MNTSSTPFDFDDLPDFDQKRPSAEDLAALQAFEARQDWSSQQAFTDTPVPDGPFQALESFGDDDDEMLILFVSEIEEDIASMKHALDQLEQEDHIQPAHYLVLDRAAHKIRGTAGAMEFHTMAAIAHIVELIIDHISAGTLFPLIGVRALALTVHALEETLNTIVSSGNEQDEALHRLELELEDVNIQFEEVGGSQRNTGVLDALTAPVDDEVRTSIHLPAQHAHKLPSASQFVQVDIHRFEHLMHHTELLAGLRTPMEGAQAQMDMALQELHRAQTRLYQLESSFSALFTTNNAVAANSEEQIVSSSSTPSLITRILRDASLRLDAHRSPYERKVKARPRLTTLSTTPLWDELEIEHYGERDTLLRALNEAIADVTMASSRVRIAFTELNQVLQHYTVQSATLRNDMLRLRLAPLSRLVPRLRRAIGHMAEAQQVQIEFEASGEATEIDQDILEALALLMLHLLRSCIAGSFHEADEVVEKEYEERSTTHVWLRAHGIANEITIELGFSLMVPEDGLSAAQESIQHLKGTLSVQPNDAGGRSFVLHLPRSQGAVRCLLVRADTQQLIVPFSQVLRVADTRREQFDTLFSLRDLLGLAAASHEPRIQPALVLLREEGQSSIAVTVDEVVGDVETIVKPLPGYLQRPGIVDAAIDGKERVLLMIDLPGLISNEYTQRHETLRVTARQGRRQHPGIRQVTVLIADDSVFIRRTISHTLKHAGFAVIEARDGQEAQELLTSRPPDICLVDIEMPKLNGYDLLSMVRHDPALAQTKFIMLTSRTTEKHRQRAFDLGAHDYLTKPCLPDTLLGTIERLLS